MLFGLAPGLLLAAFAGIALRRWVYARRLTRSDAHDPALAPFTAGGRYIPPIPAIAALMLLVYGLSLNWAGRDATDLIRQMIIASTAMTLSAGVLVARQLARAFPHGWAASGTVFNTLVAAPIPYGQLVLVRIVVLTVSVAAVALVFLACGVRPVTPDPVTGPWVWLSPRGANLPVRDQIFLVAALASAGPLLLVGVAGLAATLVWGRRYGVEAYDRLRA